MGGSTATRASWKALAVPVAREPLFLPLSFTDSEWRKLRQGHLPGDMDDKWFIFFEDGWLYFHRSWTGACIFGLRLEGTPIGVNVTEAWASRDPAHYRSPGLEEDKKLVQQLIRLLLQA